MSQGVPGVSPPKFLQRALGEASISPSSFGYGPVDGDPALRKALAVEIKNIYGLEADVGYQDVALTSGCNMAFVAAVMSLADAGDEVVLPVPWYVVLSSHRRGIITDFGVGTLIISGYIDIFRVPFFFVLTDAIEWI
jgi:aspartate/methionine/tyrosine aminotransferase